MADVTRVTVVDPIGKFGVEMYVGIAGEILPAAAPCRINLLGQVEMADANECTISNVSDYMGFSSHVALSGQPITLYGAGSRISYGTGLLRSRFYYISATPGELADAKVASSDTPVAVVVSTTDIVVLR